MALSQHWIKGGGPEMPIFPAGYASGCQRDSGVDLAASFSLKHPERRKFVRRGTQDYSAFTGEAFIPDVVGENLHVRRVPSMPNTKSDPKAWQGVSTPFG